LEIQYAIRLMQEACVFRHLSINTEKTSHWLRSSSDVFRRLQRIHQYRRKLQNEDIIWTSDQP